MNARRSCSARHRELWTHTFTEAGTTPFHCTPHPSMQGEILV